MKKKYAVGLVMGIMAMAFTGCGDSGMYSTIDDSVTGKVTKLGAYKNLTYAKTDFEVTDEDVEEEMQDELQWYADYKEIDKEVIEEGDFVNIDFVGRKDGQVIEDATAEGYDYEVADGEFIDGFLEEVVGRKKGDNFKFDITFPEDYYDESMAGEDVEFEVTINRIQEEVTPELNEEFVKETLGYESMEEYRAETKRNLIESYEQEGEESAHQELLAQIIENSEFSITESDLESATERNIEEMHGYAEMFGMEYSEFLEGFMGCTEEEYVETAKEEAENQMKTNLLLQEIIKKEKLGISEKEYEQKITDMAEEYGYDDVKELEEDYGKESLIGDLLYQTVLDYLLKVNTAK